MNITFRQGSEELSEKAISRAQLKLTQLAKLISERTDEAFVYVDVERESGSRNSERMWRCSINLDDAALSFNAVGTGNTTDKAIDLATKELKHELRKAKGKHMTIARRGHELLKRMRQSE